MSSAEDGELGRGLARRGRETAEEYSWENAALGHAGFYREILEEMKHDETQTGMVGR